MAALDVFVGVDGGGTKTLVTVIDAQERVLASAKGGSTNPNSVGREASQQNLLSTIQEALHQIAGQSPRVVAITLAMAGVDRPSDSQMVKGWVAEKYPETRVDIFTDAVAALASGTRGKLFGIVCISGTGMIAYGRKGDEEARAGGWGVFTDGGSGYSIGIEVLKAVWASYDTSGPRSSLEEAVVSHLQLSNIKELISWTYGDLAWARVASLAPVCFAEQAKGDAVANTILVDAANRLVNVIVTVAKKLHFAPSEENKQQQQQSQQQQVSSFPIVLSGSINQQPLMTELIGQRLRALLPGAEVVHPQVDAAMAAALLAFTNSRSA